MTLRELVAERAVLGTFLKIPRTEVVDVVARVGLDFVICDMEHAQVSEVEAREVIRAARANDLPVIVRVADVQAGLVNRLLEAGADGIQMPRVRGRADGQLLRDVTAYPPSGRRSIGTAHRAAGYGDRPLQEYLKAVDGAAFLVGQFETREIEDRADDVVHGLDVAFIGPGDLPLDFGVPGKFDAPPVQERVQLIEAAAARQGVHMGIFAASAEAARRAAAKGYRYLAISGDVTFLRDGAQAVIQQYRS